MAKSKSSRRWLHEHQEDTYVQRARQQGYRSRAVFKLREIDERHHLLKKGTIVVDLGAAPGGWSQIAVEKVGSNGHVIALDILPMKSLSGVEIIQGDFCKPEVYDNLLKTLGTDKAGVVISDMAPNISGMKSVDQPRAMYLAELALDLARRVLAPGGDFLCKVFQGSGFDQFITETRRSFGKVAIIKPEASRSRSREVYVLARNYQV